HGQLKVRQVDSYYPFGMNVKGLTANSTDATRPNEYMYNGKQMQDEMGLNLLDYGARFYDAVLGRWHSPDPLAEDRNMVSPYNYCQNNPISRIDEDGFLDTDFGIDENGNIKQIGKTNKEPDKLYALLSRNYKFLNPGGDYSEEKGC
ncbi:MAG: RHS repeat-associated core domain-containing protein, partial [Bacteroidota bacterium]